MKSRSPALRNFPRGFIWSSGLATLLLAGGLHIWWAAPYSKLPPRLPFPRPGVAYVALYDLQQLPGAGGGFIDAGSTDHYLFHSGILGFRKRIQGCDLFLFGSSHMEFGVSASQLSRKLSEAEGRPVHVFNLALTGSGMTSNTDLLRQNELHKRAVVIDLFAMHGKDEMREFELNAVDASVLKSYVEVWKTWTKFAFDWFCDGYLPRFSMRNSQRKFALMPDRFLKFTVLRNWNNGDAESFWRPEEGLLYPVPASGKENSLGTTAPFASAPNAGVGRSLSLEVMEELQVHPIFIVLPYDGYQLAVVPQKAQPYIPISHEGLLFYDTTHLDGNGRRLATERLFEGIQKLGLRFGKPAEITSP